MDRMAKILAVGAFLLVAWSLVAGCGAALGYGLFGTKHGALLVGAFFLVYSMWATEVDLD